MQWLEPIIGEARGTIGVTRRRNLRAAGTATSRPVAVRSRAAAGGRLSGRSLRREVSRLVSVPGSAKGGLGALAWHHVCVGTITFAVRGLGGPVVGGKRAGGGEKEEIMIFSV